jgi:hypothetical protein
MVMRRLNHAGGAISIMIAVILSGGRTRFRNVGSVATWLTAPLAIITVELGFPNVGPN